MAVQATFTCNACRFESPLNHFELADGVVCTRCGLEQRYEPAAWRELVSFAHRVGDFGSGGPQGRLPDPDVAITPPNLFPHLGTRHTWVEGGQHKATPGNPLCKRCQAPSVVKSVTRESLEVACSSCEEQRRYERPATAQRIKQLAGVLADEHEEGGREVAFNQTSGVVVLSCPSCAAPLADVNDGDGVIVCGYCQAACRISTHSHARAGHKNTPKKTWWLYFDQPSPERKKRINQAKQVAARAEKQRQHEEKRARSRAEEPTSRPAPSAGDRAAEQRQRHRQEARENRTRAKDAQRKAIMPLIMVAVAAPILGAIIFLDPFGRFNHDTKVDGAVGKSSEVLKQFSFSMSPSQTGTLLGVAGSADMTPTFDGAGVIEKARIYRGAGSGPSYGITLFGGEKLDLDAVLQRLIELAPHRVDKKVNGYEINIAKSLLRFDSRVQPQYRGTIQVSTWVRDDDAIPIINALWSLARYAAFGSPKPTADELTLVNGPPLTKLAGLDLTVPIEQAAKRVTAAFPWANCQTINDITRNKTQMVCKIEVDDALVREVALSWSHAAQASIEAAAFVFAKSDGGGSAKDGISACLDDALGPGQDVVIDHATGASERRYALGDAGDQAVIERYGLSLAAPDSHDVTVTPRWVTRFPAIVAALDGCER